MRVTLRERKHKNYISFYLDVYYSQGQRDRVTIKGLQKILNPKTTEDRQRNKDVQRKAEIKVAQLRNEYENQLLGIPTPKPRASFIKYADQISEAKAAAGSYRDKLDAIIVQLKKYADGKDILFEQINENWMENFKSFLLKRARTKHGEPFKTNTASMYFDKIKFLVHQAHNDGIILRDPALNVRSIKQIDTHREFLELSELKILVESRKWEEDIMLRAFIFSCYTGLRYIDLSKLKLDQVKQSEESGYFIDFTHQKTQAFERLYIADHVYQLINDLAGDNKGLVFRGLRVSDKVNVRAWVKECGIPKYITFHSGRHTNATLLLYHKADLYTVSQILGHKDIKTTQIYLHAIDEKLREASTLIPNLF
ncbi:MAG: hypothetical protein COB85_07870 [Bacteroidetes bacterium]|nr:MAG: hypothetical protein COB85_07870 [Bacteroidota bacterium]